MSSLCTYFSCSSAQLAESAPSVLATVTTTTEWSWNETPLAQTHFRKPTLITLGTAHPAIILKLPPKFQFPVFIF